MILRRLYIPLLLIGSAALTGGVSLRPTGLTPSEERGKQIYLEGRSGPNSSIKAFLSGTEISATVLPCGSCHGEDGKGRAEGGVVPSDIRYATLTRNYQQQRPDGRTYAPYDEKTLARAIASGTDPSGAPLDPAMPRYQLSETEMADLIAYLHKVGDDLAPGVSTTAVKVAVLLPAGGLDAALPQACAGVLAAYFDRINQRGGVYRRRIEPVFWSRSEGGENAQTFLEREQPFALTASFIEEDDLQLRDFILAKKIPVCSAISGYASNSGISSKYIFYLSSGIEAHAKALITSGTPAAGKKQKITLVHADNAFDAELAKRIGSDAEDMNARIEPLVWPSHASAAYIAQAIQSSGSGKVLYMSGAGTLTDLAHELERAGSLPHLLLPLMRISENIMELPLAFQGKVTLACPIWSASATAVGLHELSELKQVAGLGDHFSNVQMLMLASAKVFVEGLMKSGNSLTREGLVSEIEKLTSFKTEFLPGLTYGLNRRIGTDEVFIAVPDLETKKLVLKSGN